MEYLQYIRLPWVTKSHFRIVLNLIINGIPSILVVQDLLRQMFLMEVLNLIINGIPSIPQYTMGNNQGVLSFKPYYKWNTFNTLDLYKDIDFVVS